MSSVMSPKCLFFYTLQLLILLQAKVFCFQHKVGDLSAWNIPTAANPDVYIKWSNKTSFRVGDSLMFLYPPSQDSVIQVTPQSYKTCNIKDPILFMNDGNSLFNITQPGDFYFTSGEAGHCQKGQKLHIFLDGKGAIAYAPSEAETAADGPSYQQNFGSIPTAAASSIRFSTVFGSLIVFAIWVLV
ncbi:mavicyanin-like [Chenopodium quinoa]|uniref:Phytocyanin domain-containing protein n=1 Tax=Chenopodium quinoa TaxID=63459 RepID=A0A803LWQ3_CHEQI|nr:mavicyanin-like [Chenopodium quinoa]